MSSNTDSGKSKLAWIALGVGLLLVVGILVGRSLLSNSSSPSASESARSFQATPEATVNTMFEMFTQQFQEKFIGLELLDDGTNLPPDEQKFAQLFWDRQRAGVIYQGLYSREAELQNISSQDRMGDSVNVAVSLRAFPSKDADEKSDVVYTLELRQRGPNWYIYDLRGANSPVGVYERFLQLKDGRPAP